MVARPAALNRTLVAITLIAALLSPLFVAPQAARAAVDLKINFQRPAAAVPTGYLRDFGQPYGPRVDANQGTGQTYGWIDPATGQPLDLATIGTTGPGNGRDRNFSPNLDQRLDTLMHMQADDIPGTFNGLKAEGAWEIALPNDSYDVTVVVGDAAAGSDPERHTLRVEGQVAVQDFVPSGNAGSLTRFKASVIRVTLTDGKLTIDAVGGVNTKINYIDIVTAGSGQLQPRVTTVSPSIGAGNVPRNIGISAGVFVPNGGIRADSVNANTVFLTRQSDAVRIPSSVNTTGGGDSITLQPNALLDPDTTYIFNVTSGVVDAAGVAFVPFSSTFTTGQSGGSGSTLPISFQQLRGLAAAPFFSSLAIGPDGKLYAASLEGYVYRYTIGVDGQLGAAQVIDTVRVSEGNSGRAIIGLAFDPAATADNLILWVSHNGPYVAEGAADWTGQISRLSGANLELIQDYVINLPHSFKDHMVNSIAFRPGEATTLYVNVGSNSAMGDADAAWGQRPERLLNGAILRVNLAAIATPPLDVKTEEGGSYNPFALNAPVKLYASGVRNAYDLVWHSNGQLYVPTNGSAAGGNIPATPASLPASCANRIDVAARGAYSGPQVPAVRNVAQIQKDWLFRITEGGYYGHPNPLRCEWVMNGGNPTTGAGNDGPTETPEYPAGVLPDRNYRGISYDFGVNKSPNGAIEYKSDVFGPVLKGKLLVVRYSQGKDIMVLEPGGANNDIVAAYEGMPGMTNLGNPLDLIENPANGHLYVIEFASGVDSKITLLRPLVGNVPQISATPAPVFYTERADATPSAAQVVTVRNVGTAALNISGIQIIGAGASSFAIGNTPATTIAQGDSAAIELVFNPAQPGPAKALLQITSDAANAPSLEIPLRGLGVLGTGGANEPSLQWILDTYDIGVNVGDPDPTNNSLPTSALLGDEVALQRFERADNANLVVVEPLAIFGPTGSNPVTTFGRYSAGAPASKSPLFSVGNDPASNGQRINPALNPGATLTFDPGTASFGFYSIWPAFSNREVFSEDSLNTFANAVPHHVRVYPLKTGNVLVPNAYVVAFEETTSGHDYQDVVVIVRNVRLAGSNVVAAPTAPINLSAQPADARVTLTWNAGPGTVPESYRVYRSLTATVNTAGAPLATTTQPTYSDTAVVNGTTYYYAVVAAAANLSSPRSAVVNAAPLGPSGALGLQNLDGVPYEDRLVFNRADCCTSLAFHRQSTLRILNTSASEPLNVSQLVLGGADPSWYQIIGAGNAGPFTIAPGQFRDVPFRFVRDQNFTGTTSDPNNPGLIEGPRNAIVTIYSSDPNTPARTVALSGYNLPQQGGENEPTLQEVLDNFGYGSRILGPGQSLRSTNGLPVGSLVAVGDEVLSGFWLRANGEEPVYVRQLLASSRTAAGERIRVGGVEIRHGGNEYQSYLPLNNQTPPGPTEMTITPSTATPFEIQVAGLGTNRAFANPNNAHGVRLWPLRDRAGVLVPNSYIVAHDYVSTVGSTAGGVNYDYQDNVYLITNIRPANAAADPTLGEAFPGSPSLVLEFDNANYPGTLADKNGATIGFPETQRNRTDSLRPDLAPTSSYSPTLLTLNTSDRGTLTLRSADGVNSNTVNSLVNGLCLPFDSRAARFQASARLVGPFTFTKAFQQAGLMFGYNQDNFIKLVAGVRSGTTPTIYMAIERDGVIADSPPAASAALPNQGSIQTLELRLVGDPGTGVVEGFYSIDGGAFQRMASSITLSGIEMSRFFDKNTRACTLASHRLSALPFNAVYDRFAVELPAEITTGRQVLTRINTGGATVTAGGQSWQADTGLYTPNTSPNEPSANPATNFDVANTTLDRIYQDYRGKVDGAPQDQRLITYEIPISGGRDRVAVRLHFAELYWGLSGRQGPNKRVFDVYAEGRLVLNDLDIFSAAGAARSAVVVPIENIPLDDDSLTLTFSAELDQVSVAAIEVLAALTNGPIVDAGANQQVDLGASVQLAGAVTGNNPPFTTTWTQTGGPSVALSNPSALNPTFTAPATRSLLTFRLSATDALGLSNSATVQIQVGDTPIAGLAASNNSPKLFNEVVTFGATITAGDDVTYAWDFGDGSTGTGATPTHVYTTPGSFTATVTASNDGGSSSATTSVTILAEPPFELRINAGGPAYTDDQGRAWLADLNTTTPRYSTGNTVYTNSNAGLVITNGEPNPTIYRSERYGTNFGYNIPNLPSDDYIVTLHFAEIYLGAAGGAPTSTTVRRFDVNITDPVVPAGAEPEINDLNLRAQYGTGVAAKLTYTVRVTDGTLNIILDSRAAAGGNDNAKISGIEIVRVINGPPTVNAGPDQTVQPGALVTLGGSVSDPEGTATTFTWTQTAGAPVTLTGANTLTPSFTAATKGVYTFRLTGQDAANQQSSDTVTITASNRAPTVTASATPATVDVGEASTLAATASDPDGDSLTYSWAQTSGPAGGALSGANTASASFTPAAKGVYVFTITVSDGDTGGSATATATVTASNRAPEADAGDDQAVDVGASVALEGSASSDPDGDQLSYAWTQTAGPNVTLTGATTATPSFNAPAAPTTLTFELIVSDNEGLASGADSVTITVNEIAIDGLSAGSNSPTVLGQPTSFNASVLAGSNVTYAWDFGDGTTGAGATVSHTYAAAGAFTVTVTATNSQGSTDTTLLVTVTNAEPLADAGSNQAVLVGAAVALDGSASSDPDGHTPLAYSWKQSGGPAVILTGATTAAPTFSAPATPAVLAFELTVTDSRGLAGAPDSVLVTVSDSEPQDVTASNNGPTTLGQPTTLSATAAGTNLTYAWDFGDGTTGAGATVSHTYAAEGSYVATVTVTNSSGTLGTASTGVEVTNAAPLASAGADRGVDIGAAVTLSATGSSDPDGHTPLSYAWTQQSGPAVTLGGAATATASFTAPALPAVLVFELTVTDSRGKSASDSVRVVVGDEAIAGLQASSSGPTVLGQATTFSASVGAGSNIAYSWNFGGGSSATGANVQFTFVAEGSYPVTVTATNALGSVSRTITVVVTNAAPTVDSGVDQEVTVGDRVTLVGTASDSDGHTPLSYAWKQLSGPTVTLNGARAATASFTAPNVEATLSFELTVTDSRGKTASDTISVDVRRGVAAPNLIFLPFLSRDTGGPVATPADLAISAFTVTPADLKSGVPVQISVTVTNKGGTAAGAFWVDLYINPQTPPTVAGVTWDTTCTLDLCQGLAWLVKDGLAPGQSTVLTLDPSSFYGPNSRWYGSFAPGTNALYVYADSWNLSNPAGIVVEGDETNNRGQIIVPGAAAQPRSTRAPQPDLPERFIPGR
jgi:PKD repeat protein